MAVPLRQDDFGSRLEKAGFEPSTPTVWLLEGLLYYLTPEAVAALLSACARLSAPKSTLARKLSTRPSGCNRRASWCCRCRAPPAALGEEKTLNIAARPPAAGGERCERGVAEEGAEERV